MFAQLSDKLGSIVKKLSGQAKFTESNVEESLREVRRALLEADVALSVVKAFEQQVLAKALGQEVLKSLTPGQAFIKIVHDELVHLMGDACENLNLSAKPPVVVMMAGLQGSGKTTSVGKLARFLKDKHHKKVMVTSCDIYRPAAIDQLEVLSQQLAIDYFPSTTNDDPIKIAKAAIKSAQKSQMDVLIVDTAGRLHVDDQMMTEIKQLHKAISPTETLFVVDSMTGQDAANTAKAFNDALPITGVILTKTDGDARGGAALSVRQVTGKPIKFMGVGEKLDALDPFHPDRVASRILGMGDVLSLVEQAQEHVDEQQAQKALKKMQKGTFDLNDFKSQLQQINKMGGIAGLLDKLPLPGAAGMVKNKLDPRLSIKLIAMIDSMTRQEKRFPDVIKGSRKRRITQGSGTTIPELNQLLKQFKQTQKMMKKFTGKGNMMRMMQAMQQGKMPPGGGMPPGNLF